MITDPGVDHRGRVRAIQAAIRAQELDGWLVYDFWKQNIFAQRILMIPEHLVQSRRFFYFIPAKGEPRKLVHSIERWNLDHLPGEPLVYLSWQSLQQGLKTLLDGAKTVAMEYSPRNAIPYVSKVDGGTVELVRSCGVQVVSSADLVQYFEARWTEEQYRQNLKTASILRSIVDMVFAFIRRKMKRGFRVTEYEVQQFILSKFEKNGLTTEMAPNCSVNANTGNPHYEPTKEIHAEIRVGDFVLIDLWAKNKKPGSTYADITWTAFVGAEVPEEYRRVFDAVKGARDAAVDFIREAFRNGKPIRGCDVDDVARGFIRERGYGQFFLHRTGHSIGKDLHGNGANIDNLETHDERLIVQETSFSIEPGIYFLEKFGVRSELDVFVTRDGEVVVTGQPVQEEIIPILR
ncbi:MAG: M24 family metallopeptidase [Bacteroidota bacterium]